MAVKVTVFTCFLLAALATGDYYCPSTNDFVVAYYTNASTNQAFDGGWMNKGGGAMSTKCSFNLLGGFVEFDIDVSGVKTGVNANIYSISPTFQSSEFDSKSDYCDGAATGSKPWCAEVDWIESNGNCGGQTTLHTVQGPGSNGCTAWGCEASYHYNGHAKFHMRVQFDLNGLTFFLLCRGAA